MTTATVEVLTAEVRVLMVGSRQITLSVARQLDQVYISKVDPFGRIRLTDKDPYQVIGRHIESGELVRARYEPHSPCWLWDLDRKITVCVRSKSIYDPVEKTGYYHLTYDGQPVRVSQSDAEFCGGHNQGEASCSGWSTNGLDDAIRACIEEYRDDRQHHEVAKDLPLIVLAGLR